MAGKQRQYRQRIRTTQSLEKIFHAMELIAASRIGRARGRVGEASPYAAAITRAITAVVSRSDVEHPLTTERDNDIRRAALLVVTADRGMAGAYSAGALRESERLREALLEEDWGVDQYVVGRRGVSFYAFRHRPLARAWVGDSDSPTHAIALEIAQTLLRSFLAEPEDGGVAELHVVYTHFRSMLTQEPRVIRLLPMEIVEEEAGSTDIPPIYDFEPTDQEVLDALLMRYIETRVYHCLIQSAASELAARQRAMNTATKNAKEIIDTYTRLANQARQAEITQEISEIVSGADALAAVS